MESGDELSILDEGRNCWRLASAGRLAILVDAKAYFSAFKSAALNARRSIMIVGWDVHSRTLLEFPDEARPGMPNELGPFLNYVASRTNGPEVRILAWNSPLLYAPDREWLPQVNFDWATHPRMCFARDAAHPLGASQHQKIVVIDDCVAFLGGVDLTLERLDDVSHTPGDPRRRTPDGKSYLPHHDLQVMVDRGAARILAQVARSRWFLATGEQAPQVQTDRVPWPDEVTSDLTRVEVGIARTLPYWRGRPEIREIEALFVDAIRQARHWIYIEQQYFSCNRVAYTLAARLQEAEGPEVVLILPRDSTGWLEESSMGLRRRHLLEAVRQADRHGRFRVYAPVVGERGDVPVKVHAKVMIVDGRHLHAGSANMNNRSMGLDSECDLAIDAKDRECRERFVALRDRLLAEHLGTEPTVLRTAIAKSGSLISGIEALRTDGRSLIELKDRPLRSTEALLSRIDLLDPMTLAEPERVADELTADGADDRTLRRGILRFAAVLLVLMLLAATWQWGPLADLSGVGNLETWGLMLREHWIGTVAVMAVYVVGSLLMVPVVALIAATGLIYGPVSGLLVAAAGSLLGAAAGYVVGLLLSRSWVQRLAGTRLDRLNRQLARRGVLSITLIRLLPLAPFTLVNLAAGASHIRFRDFILGTGLGMAPGITALTLFTGQLGRFLKEPDFLNLALLIGLLLLIAGIMYWCWRRFGRRRDNPSRLPE